MAGLRIGLAVVLLAGCATAPPAEQSAVRVADSAEMVAGCERVESFEVFVSPRAKLLLRESVAKEGNAAVRVRAAEHPDADTAIVASYEPVLSGRARHRYTAFSYNCFGGQPME